MSALRVKSHMERITSADLAGGDQVGQWLHEMLFNSSLEVPGAIPRIRPFQQQVSLRGGTALKEERITTGNQDALLHYPQFQIQDPAKLRIA